MCFVRYRNTWKRDNQYYPDNCRTISRERSFYHVRRRISSTKNRVLRVAKFPGDTTNEIHDAGNLPSKCGPTGWLILPLESHRSSVFDSTSTELRVRIRENDNPGKVFVQKKKTQNIKEKNLNIYGHVKCSLKGKLKKHYLVYLKEIFFTDKWLFCFANVYIMIKLLFSSRKIYMYIYIYCLYQSFRNYLSYNSKSMERDMTL